MRYMSITPNPAAKDEPQAPPPQMPRHRQNGSRMSDDDDDNDDGVRFPVGAPRKYI